MILSGSSRAGRTMDELTGPGGLDADALALLQRAGIERDEIGERLARYEYLALRAELRSPDSFVFHIALSGADQQPDRAGHFQIPEMEFDDDLLRTLPRLPVPLGRIAWVKRPESLPVTGILVEPMRRRDLAASLLSLLSEHHHKPFARLVFLCRTLEPVHVLGRYGFICHHVPDTALDRMTRVFSRRYGMSQVWSLQSGKRIVSIEPAPEGLS